MFSTPFIDSSREGATERKTVSALAPGYTAVTKTDGGAISGNCCKGSLVKPNTPRITNKMEITVASTGLCINILNIVF
jgi:hypothetical protein